MQPQTDYVQPERPLSKFVTFDLQKLENSDNLSIAYIDGTEWQCVTETSQWGDIRHGIYISIDALLDTTRPEFNWLKPSKTMSNGHPAHRLKTIRLRKALSQGLLIPLSTDMSPYVDPLYATWPPDYFDLLLGIERYEPPVPAALTGDCVKGTPGFDKYTRIENGKNFPGLFTEEAGQVRITEKIHGTNFRVGLVKLEDGTWKYCVGSHNTEKDPDGYTIYARIARRFFPIEKLMQMLLDSETKESFIIYGEIYGSGIQDLIYGCKVDEKYVRIFDVNRDGLFRGLEYIESVASRLGIQTVPLLYRGEFSVAKIKELRDGMSTIPGANNVREGIVVTSEPELEVNTKSFKGRKILKYISDSYLERKGAKDGH
jgi:RNA ligase (TIGR02306 family)